MGLIARNINFGGNFTGIFPQAPEASFNASPKRGSTSTLTVAFTDTSTGSPTAWLWDFKNDGTATSTQQNPSYTYTTLGTYSVKLTVTNSRGVASTATSVNLISFNVAPAANFTGSPRSGQPPLTVNFTDSSTGSPTAWAWDFTNDGSTDSTAQNPSYTYSSTGTYTVKMTASSEWGSSTSTQVNYITVSSAPPPPSDQYFAYTVLDLPGTGTNNTDNNTFLDSSSNNFTITRVGNTTQGSFSPFSTAPGYWSNYFDGSGDYLTAPANSAFAFGTGDFTVEFWVYTNSATAQMIFDTIQPGISGDGSNRFYVVVQADQTIIVGPVTNSQTSTNKISLGTWNHVAVVRSGTTRTIYINGVSGGSASLTNNLSSNYATIGFDTAQSGTIILNGYLSNLRVVKGTAVYTGNFTPPTEPLTAISGTSLLTCQSNRFIDSSSNAFTITVNGDTSVSALGPFVPPSSYDAATMGGSMYFDGEDDLRVTSNSAFSFGSGNFTLEMWVYPTSSAAGQQLISSYLNVTTLQFAIYVEITGRYSYYLSSDGSSWNIASNVDMGAFTVNAWNHVALVRNGNTFTPYINGIAGTTTTSSATLFSSSSPFIVGNAGWTSLSYGGYVSNLRVVKGTAVYTTNFTPPTAPVSAISGTSLLLNGTNAAIYDESVKNNLDTLGAVVRVSTTISANGSMYFDGTGKKISMPAGSNFAYDTSPFTIEAWVNTSAYNSGPYDAELIFSQTVSGNNYLIAGINVSGFAFFLGGNTSAVAANTQVPLNTWTHLAFVREGTGSNQFKIYMNGQLVATGTMNVNFTNTTWRPTIGDYTHVSGQLPFNGYINDLRITKGIARYTGNFTPPTRS